MISKIFFLILSILSIITVYSQYYINKVLFKQKLLLKKDVEKTSKKVTFFPSSKTLFCHLLGECNSGITNPQQLLFHLSFLISFVIFYKKIYHKKTKFLQCKKDYFLKRHKKRGCNKPLLLQ